MSPALEEFLRQGPIEPDTIDRFLAGRAFPEVSGNTVTFVFHGDVDEVYVRHWIFGLPSTLPFQRVAGTDLWYHVADFPDNSRIEYKLEIVRGENHQLILDPLNPHRAHDPFGANSVCQSSGYESPEWAELDPEAREGTIDSITLASEVYHDQRMVRVYLPARFRRRVNYPLLIVHDGDDYLRFSKLKIVLDNLIHRLEIPPMIVALSNPHDRLREYAACEDHSRHIVNELFPTMTSRFPLIDRPNSRGLMGASFGAIAALFTAWRHQGMFGKLLLQSGSFGFTDIGDHRRGPAFDPVVEFMNKFREQPGRPANQLFASCGTYESLIYENRSMLPLFQSTGMQVRYVESRDGHNWENWRDRSREGLSWLFPGPLRLVYE